MLNIWLFFDHDFEKNCPNFSIMTLKKSARHSFLIQFWDKERSSNLFTCTEMFQMAIETGMPDGLFSNQKSQFG
jgi:hypothetical protein